MKKRKKPFDRIQVRLHRGGEGMPYLVTFTRTFNDGQGAGDQQQTDEDTFVLQESALTWINAKVNDAWAKPFTLSVQTESTKFD